MKINIGRYFLVIISTLILSYAYFYALFRMLVDFDRLSNKVLLIAPCICSIITLLIVLGVFIYKEHACKISRLENWFSNIFSAFVVFCVFSGITFLSIKNNVLWDIEHIENFVSLQWTIFAITITIFIVWNGFVFDKIKESFPKNVQKQSIIEKTRYIAGKISFYQKVSLKLNSVIFLVINLIVLLCSTSLAYVSFNDANLINQNFTIASFYFCIASLVFILWDILEPLLSEIKVLLKKSKVYYTEAKQLNNYRDELYDAVIELTQIDLFTDVGEEKLLKAKATLDSVQKKIMESDSDEV